VKAGMWQTIVHRMLPFAVKAGELPCVGENKTAVTDFQGGKFVLM